MKEFKLKKRYSKSIKLSDGSIQSFATELETSVNVANAEEFIAESTKLFEQCRGLTEQDIKNTLGGN